MELDLFLSFYLFEKWYNSNNDFSHTKKKKRGEDEGKDKYKCNKKLGRKRRKERHRNKQINWK